MKKLYLILTISLAVVLVGVVTAFGITFANTTNALGAYKSQLNYVYQQNFYELVDNVNNIESDLGKLSITTSSTNASKYLTNLSNTTSSAQDNISTLPIEHDSITDTIKFINQLGGFVYTKQTQIASGTALTLDDYDQIETLHDTSETIKYELNKLSVLVSSGNYSIVDNSQDPTNNESDFSSNWSGLNNGSVEYPTLIYDGPFSDSTTNKTIKGLSATELTATEAEVKVKEWFPDYTVKNDGEESGGDFDVYNFTLTKGDNTYYAEVTKRDGMLIQLNAGQTSNTKNKTLTDCEALAVSFATTLGYENMTVVWSTSSSNFAYINLAPTQNDVILYPDIIKVKVSQETGDIIGWEAQSWAYNHITRTNLTAGIELVEARLAVSSSLDVRASRLVLIPGEYVGEILAYEFICVYSGATYYVYVDASTGDECNVLKVIETDDGTLLM